jgi:hypothetical protein
VIATKVWFVWLTALILWNGCDATKAQAIVPDPTLTPGAVRTTDAFDVCSHGTRQLRHMSRDRSEGIMAAYGLRGGRHEAYEIDHLIPLSIGGSDDDANLWPEPRRMIEPEWSAERKDELEMRLRGLVCAGRIEIVDAQKAIAEDWTQAWLRYVHFVSLSGDPVRLNKDRNAG